MKFRIKIKYKDKWYLVEPLYNSYKEAFDAVCFNFPNEDLGITILIVEVEDEIQITS